ncbi:unnamed protein product [Spodoptera exigua]|nr:unnamed protein product [Spodoptera exigua]
MPECRHCEDHLEDTVELTVAVCPAWADHRRVLRELIGGGDLSRPALVEAMMRSESNWKAVSPVCIYAKEEAKVKKLSSSRPSRRSRRHSGCRGSGDDLRPP